MPVKETACCLDIGQLNALCTYSHIHTVNVTSTKGCEILQPEDRRTTINISLRFLNDHEVRCCSASLSCKLDFQRLMKHQVKKLATVTTNAAVRIIEWEFFVFIYFNLCSVFSFNKSFDTLAYQIRHWQMYPRYLHVWSVKLNKMKQSGVWQINNPPALKCYSLSPVSRNHTSDANVTSFASFFDSFLMVHLA